MIIDVTGIILTPGNSGNDCQGKTICCDECDYLLCCTTTQQDCKNCTDTLCPRKHDDFKS